MKRIAKWTVISILFQLAVLSYFNFIYLPGRNEGSVVILNPQEESIVNRRVKLPREASNIKVSYNGRYAAYLYEKQLRIVDTNSKRIIKTLSANDRDFSYFRWLQDRNMVIYSPNPLAEDSSLIEIFTYDVDWDILRNYPIIEVLEGNSKVTGVALSPLTNMVYIKIQGSARASIYKFDIMDNLSFVMDVDGSAIMEKAFFSDNLILQDESSGLYVWNGKEKLVLEPPITGQILLLGLGNEDNIFVGELDSEGKVCKVLAGELDSGERVNWKEIEIELAARAGDTFVSREGDIYLLEKEKNTINNLTKKNSQSYKGDYIELVNKYIVTRNGRYLIIEEVI